MVPMTELTEDQVLDRLQKILKGVTIVPPGVGEYDAEHPPPAVNLILLQVVFIFYLLYWFLDVSCLLAGIGAQF
jgi:hypothetical protein